MDSPAWLAWLMVLAAIIVAVLLFAGRRPAKDDELEAALRWHDRQTRRMRNSVDPAIPPPVAVPLELSPQDISASDVPIEPHGPVEAAIIPVRLNQSSDDLTRLKGVGPRLAAQLAESGITRFAQIAAWSADDIVRVDATLGSFAGRILRDDWVGQARLLADDQQEAFQRRYGKVEG